MLIGVFLASNVTTAMAASADSSAYVYGFNYGDGVNTTGIARQEQMYLNNLGYKTYCNTQVSASFAVGISPQTRVSRMNSGVFVFNGHAGPGSCQFRNSAGNNSYLTAKKSGGSYSKFENIKLKNCKAAFFMGCKTASTKRKSNYGVLTKQAVKNGAKCSFGWKESVLTSSATKFRERMFYFLRKGYSVKDSASKAASEMPWNDSTRKYSISGNGNTKLVLSNGNSSVSNKNTINLSEANRMISEENFREETKNDDGTKIYVKYIEGIPTLETIEVSKDKKNIKIKELNYSEKEAKKVLQKANRRQKSKIDIPKAIIDSGMKFCKMGESESNDIYCIIDGKTKLIRITNTEYVSVDKECYYLDTICIDLETGNQVDYEKILEGCCNE